MKSKQYGEMDDSKALEIWKSKSLNSKPTETYKISNKPIAASPEQTAKKNKKHAKQTPVQDIHKNNALPQPKTIKINEQFFCMYLYNELNVFKYLKDEQKRYWKAKNNSFSQITQTLPSDIKFVVGDGKLDICVGLENCLVIYRLKRVDGQDEDGKPYFAYPNLQQVGRKNINGLKRACYLKENSDLEYLAVFSEDKLYKYKGIDEYPIIKQTKLYFWLPQQQAIYAKTRCISLLMYTPSRLFMFGIIQDQRNKLNDKTETVQKRKCESLYLITLILEGRELGQSASAKVSSIDHIFERGIFGRTKVFQLGQNIFLLSLHQQIVIIKENFGEYVVWDNIALTPSKSNQKKGQLVLANKIVMVYTQLGQIFAQNIVFKDEDSQAKLTTPKIDNFKGNDDDEQTLYDAIVLQYQPGSFMKVLIYLKRNQVFDPSNPNAVSAKNQEGGQGDKTKMTITVLCIQQDNPVKKLQQLFRNKKPPHVISEFVERFCIDDLTKCKCQWSVSDKNEKDIENLLLEIKDNQYIQQQLTMILKQSPHDLKFLYMIETKQINRYTKMLASKILKLDTPEDSDKQYTEKQRNYIKDIIMWLMESIMFLKKINYSKNFLEFKQYDFIQIGKLKAASLRQQIKLLSCKGFEKRLKYFMNSFKYMVLFNFDDIFSFLIEDKNEHQIQAFFTEGFSFILPNFIEDSQIFSQKKSQQIQVYNQSSADDCLLWVDNIDDPAEISKIETIESFKQDVIKAIFKQQPTICGIQHEQAKQRFIQILEQFIQGEWFKKNKSKQHSILTTSIEQLKNKFEYLKKIGVFHTMIKIFYEKIKKKIYNQWQIQRVLNVFAKSNKIPLSFYANVQARKKVYKQLPLKMNIDKPQLEDFLVLQQTKYFSYLFNNYRQLLLQCIRKIYDDIQPGFFRQKFKLYLNSQQIELKSTIDFLDEFKINTYENIRFDVFTSIKKILKINDQQNTRSFVNKLMEKQILKNNQGQGQNNELIDQAKVAFGFYFYPLFKIFKIDFSYKQLIQYSFETQLQQNKFILTLLQKYCIQDYQHYTDENLSQSQNSAIHINLQQLYGIQGLPNIDIRNPSQFFGVILHVIDTLDFPLNPGAIFNQFVRLLLQQKKQQSIAKLVEEINLIDLQDEQFRCYRHYQLIGEFKQMNDHDLSQRMTQCMIRWIRQKFIGVQAMRSQDMEKANLFEKEDQAAQLYNVFEGIRNAMQTLETFLKGIQISREKQFLNMLIEIYDFHPILLYFVIPKRYEHYDQLQRKSLLIRSQLADTDVDIQQKSSLLTKIQGFIFMMRFYRCVNPFRFNKVDIDQINSDISHLQRIYEHFTYASSFKDTNNNNRAGFIRFNIQFSASLIEYGYFSYTFQVLLKCINTGECYFRDVFFHFFSMVSTQHINERQLKTFIKQFIGTEAQNLMQKRLRAFVTENNISSFQKNEYLKKEATQRVFVSILESHRLDEAFYFLIRNNNLSITKARAFCEGSFEKKDVLSYALISIYLKCLKQHLCSEFYPNFSFYKQKHAMLMNQFERKDIIKDINLALSKMKQIIANSLIQINQIEKKKTTDITINDIMIEALKHGSQGEDQMKQQEQKYKRKIIQKLKSQQIPKIEAIIQRTKPKLAELQEIYYGYMLINGLDPQIKLNEIQMKQAGQKLQNMNRFITPDQLEHPETAKVMDRLSNQQILKKQKEQEEYELKIKKTKDQGANQYYQLNKKMNQQIADARKTKQKYQKYLVQQQPQNKQMEDAMKSYQMLKQRQKSQIRSIKDSYKSQASEKVHKMLEEMRDRKSRLIQKSEDPSKYSGVSIDESKSRSNYNVNIISPSHQQAAHKDYVSKNSQKQGKNLFLPITMNNNESNSHFSSRKNSYFSKDGIDKKPSGAISPLSSYKSIPHSQNKQSINDMIKLFQQRQPQCKKYVEKLEFVKNNLQVGIQLTKSIYQSIFNFDIFLTYLKFLCDFNPKYRQVIEEKAIKIAQQTLGIQYKIDLKQLFCIEFFITVSNLPLKQYYKTAFQILKPNLIKIMKKPDINLIVHGLAVLFRYGFGSENIYFHRVYEEYVRVLLTQYNKSEYDDKKIYYLAQKLRNNYKNVSADNRQYKFQQLIREISNQNKRKRLAKQILKIIERRSQMLTGENPSQIKNIMMKLC